MNSRHPTLRRHRAVGTILLTLISTFSVIQFTPAHGQPEPASPTKKSPKPLTPEQKVTVNKLLAISIQERACKKVFDLKVDNATLDDVIAKIQPLLPEELPPITIEGSRPVKLSFDLERTTIGHVLDHAGGLAGCKLYLLSSGLTITSPTNISADVRTDMREGFGGDWASNTASGGTGWSSTSRTGAVFTRAIAQEATGVDTIPFPKAVVKTTFGEFSPESQKILRELSWIAVSGSNGKVLPAHLESGSPVVIDMADPSSIAVLFTPSPSSPGGHTIGVKDFSTLR